MDTPKRHCWECRRLCLVCDFEQPACKRCTLSGTTCPGYSDTKPPRLRWLAPGTVTARRRRGKRARSSDTDASRSDIETTCITGEYEDSAVVSIPHLELRSDVSALLDAVAYYNTCIYQDLLPLHTLGHNPTVYPLLPLHVQASTLFPDHIRLSLICVTVSHRINRTRDIVQSKALTKTLYHYRGLALRSLREDIGVDHARTGDVVLAGVVTLLLSDVQQGLTSDWRHHIDAAQRLIALRGGLQVVARSKSLEAMLLCFVFLTVISNTTCPVSQLTMAQWHIDQLDFILEQYDGGILQFLICPSSLFAEIIRINQLRMRAGQHDSSDRDVLSHEALEILDRVNQFSAEQWAFSKDSSEPTWVWIGNVYQAAVTIYCISSLQSLSVLPTTAALKAQCAATADSLQTLFNDNLAMQGIGMFMIWPLVMLGMEALHGPPDMRRFVEQQLPEMSRQAGSYAPLTAKHVLERYWASSNDDWDSCFDKPYAFPTQIAVDLSRLSPP